MDKVIKWKEKMSRYYNEVSPDKLKQDLELAGFRVLHVGENYNQLRSVIMNSMTEIAASVEDNDKNEALFIKLDTGVVVSK